MSKSFTYLAVVFIFSQGSAIAWELDYSASASLRRHDNINLVNDPEREEWVKSLRFEVSLEENNANLVADISASAETMDFKYDQQEDTTISNLHATTLFIIEPRVFEWFLSDVYTQSIINPLQSDTPANRQDVNVFSSGPNFYWRLNSKNYLSFEARHQDSSYEDDIADNTRKQGAVRWNHDVSLSLSAALNYEHIKVDFDDSSLGELEKDDVFASISYRTGSTEYYVEAGKTSVSNGFTDDLEEDIYMLSVESQRTSSSTIRLEARHDISDTSISILDSTDSSDISDYVFNIATSDVFVRDEVELTYRHAWGVNSMELQLSEMDSDYRLQDEFDEKTKRVYLSGTWGISANWDITLFAQNRTIEYKSLVPYREDDDILYGVRYRLTPRRNLNFYAELSKQERDSNIESNDYEDTMALLTIEYRP